MRRLSFILIAALTFSLIFSAPAVYSEGVYDDAVMLNPDNPNIADSSNVTVQNWGSFSDDTFFGMHSGDPDGNTYVTIQDPLGGDIEYFKVAAYSHQDISLPFTFLAASDLGGTYTPLDTDSVSSSEGQAGYGKYEYECASLPAGTKYVKISYPPDDQNWRLMVASFEINTKTGGSSGEVQEDAVISINGAQMEDGKYIYSSANVQYSDWADGSVYGDGIYYQAQAVPDGSNTYIIFEAPADGYFIRFSFSGLRMSDDAFRMYTSQSPDGGFEAVSLNNSVLQGVKDGWDGQLYSSTQIPPKTKYIKAEFPAAEEGWRVLLAGYEFEWSTESSGGSEETEGYVEDDATEISGNPNIADSNNTEPQSWGNFQDTTFFAMTAGDTEGNTYITVTAPNEAYISDIKVVTYKYGDVTQDFTLEASDSLDSTFAAVKANVTTETSTHDNFNIYTYTVDTLPSGTRFVKVKYPTDPENWKSLIAGFSFNWTVDPGEEEEIPESYTGTVTDEADEKDENGKPAGESVYKSENVIVSDASGLGITDGSAYQADGQNAYIIVKVPNSGYIRNMTLNAVIRNTPENQQLNFEFASASSSMLEFEPVSASYRPAETGSADWTGKMYILSQLPAGCKLVKISWPQQAGDIKDFLIGSYKFEWNISSLNTYDAPISVQTAAFVKQGRVGSGPVDILCELTPMPEQQFPKAEAKIIIAAYSGKRLSYIETLSTELMQDKVKLNFYDVGKSGEDRIKIMVIDNDNAVKQLAEPIELY